MVSKFGVIHNILLNSYNSGGLQYANDYNYLVDFMDEMIYNIIKLKKEFKYYQKL
jgi:hypothetical protein